MGKKSAVNNTNPIVAEVTRGQIIESLHRGAIAVVSSDGSIFEEWGDIDRVVFPRSALKPLQAIAALEFRAMDAFGLGEIEIALHCGSHLAESGHVAVIESWLKRLDLGEEDLECGPQPPLWTILDMNKAHCSPRPRKVFNNCSGKHAGYLTLARNLDQSTKGYCEVKHPVQQHVRSIISEFSGQREADMAVESDSCGAPSFAMPLKNFAMAMARLVDPDGISAPRAHAARRVTAAMKKHPWYVSGSDQTDTRMMQESGFDGIAKGGAEGIFAFALAREKLGVAIKIDDGANRARNVVAMAVLRKLRLLDKTTLGHLSDLADSAIRTWSGEKVGEVNSCF